MSKPSPWWFAASLAMGCGLETESEVPQTRDPIEDAVASPPPSSVPPSPADPAPVVRLEPYPWMRDVVETVTDPDRVAALERGELDGAADPVALHRAAAAHLALAVGPAGHDAASHLSQARTLYDRVLAGAPNYAERDRALFERWMVNLLLADRDAWRADALALVRDYPQSEAVPYVYLGFGEASLDEGQTAAAITFFAKVLTFARPHPSAFALHDLGWARAGANPPDHVEALAAFSRAIEQSKAIEPRFAASARALRRSARLGLVESYARVGRPDRARDFFERVGRGPGDEDMVEEMLARLERAIAPR